MRTDEGVCPYIEAIISINERDYYNSKIIIQNSKLWLGRVDEWAGWQVNELFVLQETILSTPLSIGRGAGMRLFLTRKTRRARSLKATQSSLRNNKIHRSLRPRVIQNTRFIIISYNQNNLRRAFPCIEESLSLHRRNALFKSKKGSC